MQMNRILSIVVVSAVILMHGVQAVQAQTSATPGGTAIQPRQIRVPQIDPRAVQLLEDAANRLRIAMTLKATVERTWRKRADTVGTVSIDLMRAMRSGYLYSEHRELSGDGKPYFGGRPWVSVLTPNGGFNLSNDTIPRVFQIRPSEQSAGSGSATIGPFFHLSSGRPLEVGEWETSWLTDPLLRSISYKGREQWRDSTYDVVEWVYEKAYTQPQDTIVYTTRTFIDRNGLVRRALTTNNKAAWEMEERLTSIVLDVPMMAQDFSVSIPPRSQKEPLRPTMSFVGQKYPEFTTPAFLLDGPKLPHVTDLLRGKKATLVWFWNTTCSSCIAEMPHFEQMYRELKDKGVNVVALNVVKDTAEQTKTRENLIFNRITMPVLFDADPWEVQMRKQTMNERSSLAILDPSGTVVYDGPTDYVEIRRVLERMAEP